LPRTGPVLWPGGTTFCFTPEFLICCRELMGTVKLIIEGGALDFIG